MQGHCLEVYACLQIGGFFLLLTYGLIYLLTCVCRSKLEACHIISVIKSCLQVLPEVL